MTKVTFYDNSGVPRSRTYTDSDATEVARQQLEEQNLCVAIIDDGTGRLRKVQRGTYRYLVLIHDGQAYMIDNGSTGKGGAA